MTMGLPTTIRQRHRRAAPQPGASHRRRGSRPPPNAAGEPVGRETPLHSKGSVTAASVSIPPAPLGRAPPRGGAGPCRRLHGLTILPLHADLVRRHDRPIRTRGTPMALSVPGVPQPPRPRSTLLVVALVAATVTDCRRRVRSAPGVSALQRRATGPVFAAGSSFGPTGSPGPTKGNGAPRKPCPVRSFRNHLPSPPRDSTATVRPPPVGVKKRSRSSGAMERMPSARLGRTPRWKGRDAGHPARTRVGARRARRRHLPHGAGTRRSVRGGHGDLVSPAHVDHLARVGLFALTPDSPGP